MWKLGPHGSMTTAGTAQPKRARRRLRLDAGARPATSLPSTGNAWAADPGWDWTPVPAADGVGLPDRTLHDGHHHRRAGHPRPVGGLRLAGRRPPGHRHRGAAGRRAGGVRDVRLPAQLVPVDLPSRPRGSSPCRSTCAADATTAVATSFTQVKVPIDPIVHTFRPGTELRVVISAPGGDRPTWEFATVDDGRPGGVDRLRRRHGLEPRGQRGPRRQGHHRRCRPAGRSGASPAALTRPRATSPDRGHRASAVRGPPAARGRASGDCSSGPLWARARARKQVGWWSFTRPAACIERVARRRAHEPEAPPFELLAHGRGLRGRRRAARRPPTSRADRGRPSTKDQSRVSRRSPAGVQVEERAGVRDRGLDLAAVADDVRGPPPGARRRPTSSEATTVGSKPANAAR